MIRTLLTSSVGVIGFFTCAAISHAETPEELIGRMKTLRADIQTIYLEQEEVSQSPTFSNQKSQIKSWEQSKNGTYKFRQEEQRTIENSEQPNSTESISVLTVSDGEFTWEEMSGGPGIIVTKKPAMKLAKDLDGHLQAIKDGKIHAEVLPAEKIGEEACAVLKIVHGEGDAQVKITYWFSEKHGQTMKYVFEDKRLGTTTVTTTSVKINPVVYDKQFTYVVPDKAVVRDETKVSDE
ncbi:MAG: hypothetical protein HJJLKODD_01849 [Phycisphaerae bacterium]|nr:hypothetical protein [Phycisphaerae bacterium]